MVDVLGAAKLGFVCTQNHFTYEKYAFYLRESRKLLIYCAIIFDQQVLNRTNGEERVTESDIISS